MTHEDKALFYLDLAKNYQSYVDDYAISANFLLRKRYSRWQNLCAMWHLFKCCDNQYFFLDSYNYFTFKDSTNFELPSFRVTWVQGGMGQRKRFGTVRGQSSRTLD